MEHWFKRREILNWKTLLRTLKYITTFTKFLAQGFDIAVMMTFAFLVFPKWSSFVLKK